MAKEYVSVYCLSGSPLNAGMGPRVLPSQASQPMAQPLENQKQACRIGVQVKFEDGC